MWDGFERKAEDAAEGGSTRGRSGEAATPTLEHSVLVVVVAVPRGT